MYVIDHDLIFDMLSKRDAGIAPWTGLLMDLLENGVAGIASVSLALLEERFQEKSLEDFREWERLKMSLRIVKTPAYVDYGDKLAGITLVKYLVVLSADSIGARVLTTDENLLRYSETALHPDELLGKGGEISGVKFLDLYSQFMEIRSEIEKGLDDVLRSTSFVGGEFVRRFEEDLAAYQDAAYCVGVGNGTDALEIAIESLNLPLGSEIMVPANTFIATAEAVTRAGHRVVFCDCDRNNYTISVEDVERRITEKTKAVVAVHLYGHPCNMDALLDLAGDRGLKVIEDCAQAHGAEYRGRRVGALGDIGAFSFYPGKNLGAYGDAGAIVTNDGELARRCRMTANHGRMSKFAHEFEGRNSRLDALQAVVLKVKLNHLEQWNEKRIKAAECYHSRLERLDSVVLPRRESWARHVYHLFVIRTGRRNELRDYLKKHGIQTGIHYPTALPKLPAYEYLGQAEEAMFASEIGGELLSLPMGEHMTEGEVGYVSEKIARFFENSR